MKKPSRYTWLALASFFSLVLLLWLPFDLRRTALLEWWASNAVYDQYGLPIAMSGAFKTRPLASLAYYFGYWLSPDSYAGANVLLAVLIFARMAIPYAVGRLVAPDRPATVYVYALLFALYPADSILFSLRGVGTHFAVVCYLAAAWLLVIYWRRPRLLTLAAMCSVQGIGLLSAPTAYGAALATPLLLYCMEGRFSRRLARVSLMWWAVPALAFLYILFSSIFLPGENYLSQIWIWNGGLSTYKIKTLGQALGLVYLRHFVTCWGGAVVHLFASALYTSIGILAAVLVAVTASRHLKARPPGSLGETDGYAVWRWVAVGAAATFAGFLPFWPTIYRLADWRVYFVSPLGAALVMTLLCTWLDRRTGLRGRLFVGLSAVLVGLCVVSGLTQARSFQEKSYFEQRLLADILAQAPRLSDDTVILIMDSSLDSAAALSQAFAETHFFYPHGFVDALQFIYEDYRNVKAVVICSSSTRAECSFSTEAVTISGRISVPLTPAVVESYVVPYRQLIIFSYHENRGLDMKASLPWTSPGYDPQRLISPASGPPRRTFTLLSKSIMADSKLKDYLR